MIVCARAHLDLDSRPKDGSLADQRVLTDDDLVTGLGPVFEPNAAVDDRAGADVAVASDDDRLLFAGRVGWQSSTSISMTVPSPTETRPVEIKSATSRDVRMVMPPALGSS